MREPLPRRGRQRPAGPPFCTAEVLDADPDAPRPYLVVEYVDGPVLGAEVRQRGPLNPANLHALAIGIATALTAIHGAGVIHRDLKPGNVLLAPGSLKVIDFGIARAMETTADRHTRTGVLVDRALLRTPADRPTARELLDLLLGSEPAESPADKPELRSAAVEVRKPAKPVTPPPAAEPRTAQPPSRRATVTVLPSAVPACQHRLRPVPRRLRRP